MDMTNNFLDSPAKQKTQTLEAMALIGRIYPFLTTYLFPT